MSVFTDGAPGELPPPAALSSVVTAHYASRCLHVLATAGVADHIGETPRPVAEIANAASVNADALNRMLRLLATHGLFELTATGWRHTPASSLLRSDHPHSMRAFAAMIGDPTNWDSLAALSHSLTTGRVAAETVFPDGVWAYYAQNPNLGRQFDAAMTAKSHGDIPLLLAALDLTGVATIADIGGGRGHFLRAILDAHPALNGVLFDMPAVVANAPDHARVTKVGGDFFKDDMPKADLYLMTHIIHDWADAELIAILSNLRRAAPKGARLILYELLLPTGPEPHPAKTLDIVMMTVVGGRERTAQEFDALFTASGWTSAGVVPTQGLMALNVARAT